MTTRDTPEAGDTGFHPLEQRLMDGTVIPGMDGPVLVRALASVLENYGKHHGWCAYPSDADPDHCTCGLRVYIARAQSWADVMALSDPPTRDTPEAVLRAALEDARETILAHYRQEPFAIRTRPSVVRAQVREIDELLGNPPTRNEEFAFTPNAQMNSNDDLQMVSDEAAHARKETPAPTIRDTSEAGSFVDQARDLASLLHNMGLGCRRDYRGDADCGGAKWHEDTARLLLVRWTHRQSVAAPVEPEHELS